MCCPKTWGSPLDVDAARLHASDWLGACVARRRTTETPLSRKSFSASRRRSFFVSYVPCRSGSGRSTSAAKSRWKSAPATATTARTRGSAYRDGGRRQAPSPLPASSRRCQPAPRRRDRAPAARRARTRRRRAGGDVLDQVRRRVLVVRVRKGRRRDDVAGFESACEELRELSRMSHMPWPRRVRGALVPDSGMYTVVGSGWPRGSSLRARTVGAMPHLRGREMPVSSFPVEGRPLAGRELGLALDREVLVAPAEVCGRDYEPAGYPAVVAAGRHLGAGVGHGGVVAVGDPL
jgi:hypothetical protein